MRPPAPSTQGSTINESGGRKRRREPPFLRPELKGADPAHLVVRCVRGLKRARNRPPFPWRWWEHGSERPDSPDNREAVLKTPAGSAEVPHTANGAGHTASRDASNRPQHARIAGVARGEARRAATGRGGGLRAEPHATPFFPSRALGPMLSPSARELWPFFPRFRATPRPKWPVIAPTHHLPSHSPSDPLRPR